VGSEDGFRDEGQWRAGLKSLEVERNVANLHHYAERSRHHTKDKQRLVVSVVAYDSLPAPGYSAMFYDVVRCSYWLGSAMPFDN